MFEAFPGAFGVACLLALIPAFLRWWWGRSLVALADDPALPERLAALNRRVGLASAACGALAVVGWPSSAVATLALLVVAHLVARFPLRKVLYQETWTLSGYLAFYLRLMAGVYGLAIALVTASWVTSRLGRFDLIGGAAVALGLAVWHWYSDAILRTLIGAEPITDPALLERFSGLISASAAPMPRFEFVPMRGGVLANAVAVPSLRGSAVIFTETLLSRFTVDETVAICAHEIAHLEYYNRTRLVRRTMAIYAVIAVTSALAPIARRLGADVSMVLWIWPFVLFSGLMLRARRRQQNETASDLRAVALTGAPEELIRALAKLHDIGRVPRRWDQARERQATHPSLARRIRDIRASVGASPAPLAAPAAFPAATGAGSVTFDASHVEWIGEAGAKQALEYGSLVELRLHAAPAGVIALVATDRGGRRWQMTPRTTDVPAIQGVLDTVDGKLTHDAKAAARSFSSVLTRVLAYAIVSLASVAGQFAFALVALLSVFVPSPRLLNAAGAAGLASALLLLGGPSDGFFRAWPSLLCAALAIASFGLAWAKRAEQPRGTSVLVGILAFAAFVTLAFAGFGGIDPIRLHQGVRSDPSAVVLLAALAGAAAGWRRRAQRYLSVAALTCAAAVFVIGTTSFLYAVGRDAFLVGAVRATRSPVTSPATWEFDAPWQVATLKLSPHGGLAAVAREAYEDDSATDTPPRTFQIAAAGQAPAQYDVDDLVFVDDDRALVLTRESKSTELREIDVRSKTVVWRQRVPAVRLAQLSYQAQSRRWTILGRTADGGFTRMAGTAAGHDLQQTTWPAIKGGQDVWFAAQASRGGTLVGIQTEFEAGLLQPAMALSRSPTLYRSALLAGFQSHSQIWQLRDGTQRVAARTLLDTSCGSVSFDDRLVCAAFDGTQSHVVAIHAESAAITPLASIDGRFRIDAAGDGWVAGWSNVTPIVVRLATREMIEPPDAAARTVYAIAAADSAIATAAWSRPATRVRVYHLDN